MCGYKKIKIEYIMMAVAFASVVWSICWISDFKVSVAFCDGKCHLVSRNV